MRKTAQLKTPNGATDVLLHSCCAPCSTAIVECLLDNGIRPTLFYFNPNIHPRDEYLRRKDESLRYADLLGLDFIDADYSPSAWLRLTRELADEPERGARCAVCFAQRLTETARYAQGHGFRLFTTTLATSRWKSREQVTAAGRSAAALFPDLVYWEHDWRKGGLSERKAELTRQHAFYAQPYCGCVYSLRDANRWRQAQGKPLIERSG